MGRGGAKNQVSGIPTCNGMEKCVREREGERERGGNTFDPVASPKNFHCALSGFQKFLLFFLLFSLYLSVVYFLNLGEFTGMTHQSLELSGRTVGAQESLPL